MDCNTNRFAVSLLRVRAGGYPRRAPACPNLTQVFAKLREQGAIIGACVEGDSGRLRASCAEMKPYFRAISAALHPPELNWHLTKSRLNDAPPLCEMQRCESCLARHQEDQVDFSWARVDE